ncbi:MAG: TerB family tellurite resistance protein [Pseudomonadota bacterium]
MLARLAAQVHSLLGGAPEGDSIAREEAVQLATAVLLAEVANADRQITDAERDALAALLQVHFSLSEEATRDIVFDGFAQAEESVSLQGYTRTLHEALSDTEKKRVIAMLWSVAYADGELDRFEDALIARVGELMYVPRSDVLRLKAEAATPRVQE